MTATDTAPSKPEAICWRGSIPSQGAAAIAAMIPSIRFAAVEPLFQRSAFAPSGIPKSRLKLSRWGGLPTFAVEHISA
jgi:hypothetical protein